MVVIVILGILAGLIIPRIMGRPDEARQTKARIMIEGIETALKLYRLDNGLYPTTEQGLRALVEASTIQPVPRNWREGGYLEKGKVPKDPWGNDFVYLSPGTQGELDLISYGADGQPGGEGKNKDITNWSQD
jgi:general secretion pathway protein G